MSLDAFDQEIMPDDIDPKKYPNMDRLWPEWHKSATCLGVVDDVLFFGATQNGVYKSSAIKEAKKFCAQCPVFAECLRYALTNRESWGIWASTTVRERERIYDGLDTGLFTLEEIIEDRLEERDEHRE